MTRLTKAAPFVLAGLLVVVAGVLVAASYRVESSSRIHTDTLRREWFTTTRILGIPLVRREGPPNDPFPGVYTAITGRQPNPAHWMQRPVDHIQSLTGSIYLCHGMSSEFRERSALLEAVYQQFGIGMPRAQAAALFDRINELVPPKNESDVMPYYTKLDRLRRELGFKPILIQ